MPKLLLACDIRAPIFGVLARVQQMRSGVYRGSVCLVESGIVLATL